MRGAERNSPVVSRRAGNQCVTTGAVAGWYVASTDIEEGAKAEDGCGKRTSRSSRARRASIDLRSSARRQPGAVLSRSQGNEQRFDGADYRRDGHRQGTRSAARAIPPLPALVVERVRRQIAPPSNELMIASGCSGTRKRVTGAVEKPSPGRFRLAVESALPGRSAASSHQMRNCSRRSLKAKFDDWKGTSADSRRWYGSDRNDQPRPECRRSRRDGFARIVLPIERVPDQVPRCDKRTGRHPLWSGTDRSGMRGRREIDPAREQAGAAADRANDDVVSCRKRHPAVTGLVGVCESDGSRCR